MKKVSARVFFTVMWRGVCQVLPWFFGLFGYKRDGKFAKCVWGLFALSGTIIMAAIALAILYCGGLWAYGQIVGNRNCHGDFCYHLKNISGNIYFHNTYDGKGYVINKETGDKLIKHIDWIAMPEGKDSLVCFSNGKKCGYFSKKTGRVVIEPKYNHAWKFSEGLASVEDGGFIKFIDATGKTVIDNKMPYLACKDGYAFLGGYCIVEAEDDELYGLMDKTGALVLPIEYCSIEPTDDFKLWIVRKDEQETVLNREMKPVVPMMKCSINICDGTIDVTMSDHTIRKYDLDGRLINDFYVTGVRMLEYEKDEMAYDAAEMGDMDNCRLEMVPHHPKATARLRAYTAGDDYEGLMTANGQIVTMPLYYNITALGYDLYLCSSANGDKLIVNGNGEIVK